MGATSGAGTAYPSGARGFIPGFYCGSCYRSLALCVRCLSFCPLLAIRLSVLLRYTDSDFPFGIFKLLSQLSLDCPFLIDSVVFSNVYLDIYYELDFQHYHLFQSSVS
jgi:hypothetical protein